MLWKGDFSPYEHHRWIQEAFIHVKFSSTNKAVCWVAFCHLSRDSICTKVFPSTTWSSLVGCLHVHIYVCLVVYLCLIAHVSWCMRMCVHVMCVQVPYCMCIYVYIFYVVCTHISGASSMCFSSVLPMPQGKGYGQMLADLEIENAPAPE